MVSAVTYIHAKNVVHRDLKPENFILYKPNDINSIKLIDFGLSRRFRKGEVMHEQLGTPYYLAPEIIEGKYSEQVDMWSLGVILYVMLSGKVPFPGGSLQEILHNIKNGFLTFQHDAFRHCSLESKDLIV